ncbi:hypothetical protein B0H14DRAFT_1628726 [Mycena olivaceomarginata]|nr:hypothetical protein B0H14DRAFT_1628726 [Mycena olivaceomarginata]
MHGLLPVELVCEIIGHVLVFPPVALTDEPGTHPKPSWKLIGAFAVASKTYRTLALEAWFRVFFSKSPADLFFLENHLQGVYSWTRELYCTLIHPALSWDLAPFLHLHTIRFDYPGRIYRLPFIHTSTVTSLELRSTIWPSPFAFQAVTDTFPQLRTLRLSQPTIWCGLCNTCCRVRFAGLVPQKLVYTGGLGLPIHYARALSPLPYLHTVRIALPYSPRGTHISLDPTAPPDPNAELWAGECERCVGVMYEDLAFRTRYIARKKGVLLPQLAPSEADAERNRLYHKPPALERVEWVFSGE